MIVFFSFTNTTFSFSTTRFTFELYNNPSAENVAMSIAQAQKSLNEPEKESSFGKQDTLEMFQDMLVRQLLSRMTGSIIDEAFGEGDLEDGEYTIGDYIVLIDSVSGVEISVTITDTVTGDTTVISVPYYPDYSGTSF